VALIDSERETPWTGGTLVGIVGFAVLPECFPLGPRLMRRLRTALPEAQVENMTWGPMHVVQRFQDPAVPRPDRLVLIGAAATSRAPGRVEAFRWEGGSLPQRALQDRIYEAVTGIVELENTLAIGAHFGVWPEATWTVEADLPADSFQRMVIADSEGWADDAALTAHLGFSPARVTAALAALTTAVLRGAPGVRVSAKRTEMLAPVTGFACHAAAAGRACP
jgi:hypothetical protein